MTSIFVKKIDAILGEQKNKFEIKKSLDTKKSN